MSAFFDELEKLGGLARSMDSPWGTKTVGAPRSKITPAQFPKAPTAPGPMSPKLVTPAAKYGPSQNYSQPNFSTPPASMGVGVNDVGGV